MSVNVTVGVMISRNLKRNMDTVYKNIYKKLKKTTVEVALKHIETPAKKECRVDTGRLRSSIHTRYGNAKKAYNYKDNDNKSFDGSLTDKPDNTKTKFVCIVGTNVEYASYIEAKYPYLSPNYIRSHQILYKELEKIIKTFKIGM